MPSRPPGGAEKCREVLTTTSYKLEVISYKLQITNYKLPSISTLYGTAGAKGTKVHFSRAALPVEVSHFLSYLFTICESDVAVKEKSADLVEIRRFTHFN